MMRIGMTSKLLPALALLALLPFSGCSSDSPSEPRRDPPPTPGAPPAAQFNVTVTPQPPTITSGSEDVSTIIVRVRRADNGAVPANGTDVLLTTTLGTFLDGSQQVLLTLVNGEARTNLLPPVDPNVEGTAVVRAAVSVRGTLEGSAGQAQVRILEEGDFFIAFVEPPVGSPQGGETVTIQGQGFIRPVRVSFGGQNAQVLSASQFRITAVTPPSPQPLEPGETLPVPVTVTINVNEPDQDSDTLPNGFTYALGGQVPQQPSIISVDPSSGPNAGGTQVTILGEGFNAPVRVLFGRNGNFLEGTVQSVAPNRIVVLTPSATGLGNDFRNQSVDVVVRNVNSGTQATAVDAFRFGGVGDPIQVTGLTPLEGPAAGGTDVTVFGSGFEQPLQVTIAGVEQQVLSVTDGQIVFRTAGVAVNTCPANGVVLAAPVQVRLLTPPNGSAQSPDNFRYLVDRPQAVSLNDTSGPQGGGDDVTVSGSGFDAPVQVELSANGQTFTVNAASVSASSVTFNTPAFTDVALDEVDCDDNDDGTVGSKFVATGFDVRVINLDSGCDSNVLTNAYVVTPADTDCRGDEAPAPPPLPECSDGIDNDGDTFIDAADPQCANPSDTSESV